MGGRSGKYLVLFNFMLSPKNGAQTALKRLSLRNEGVRRFKGKDSVEAARVTEELLEARFARVRETFGYKRVEMKVERVEGSGTLRTPDFEFHVSVTPIDDELHCAQEVTPSRDRSLFQREDFQSAFADLYDEMVGELSAQTDLAGLIDRLEEKPSADLRLDYDSRCRWAELRLAQFPGLIRLEPKTFRIQMPGGIPPAIVGELLDQVEAHLAPS